MNLGTPRVLDPMTRDAILAALREREQIRAVRFYRLSTGAGSREAKSAVALLAAQHNIVSSERTAGTVAFPWSTLVLLAIAIVVAIAIFVSRSGR